MVTSPKIHIQPMRLENDDDSDANHDDSPLVTPSTSSTNGFTIAIDHACIKARGAWYSSEGTVVREVSGFFPSGQIHGIICPAGNAAEQLATVVAGFGDVSSGSVMGNDVPVMSAHFKSHVGFIGANWGCVSDARVIDNLRGAIALRSRTEHIAHLVADAAELLDITNYLDKRVDELAPGIRKRVAIAMEMVVSPAVLILVDPLDGLSHFEFQEVIQALQRIAMTGRNVLISLKRLPWGLFETLDTVMMLAADGRQLYTGSREDLGTFLSKLEAPPLNGGEAVIDLMQEWEDQGETRHVANCFMKSEAYHILEKLLKSHRDMQATNGFRRVRRVVPPPPSFPRRFARMLWYSMAHSFAQSDFLLAWFSLFISFFACVALQHRQHDNQDGMQNKRGIIFFLLSCAMYVNVIFIEAEVVDRRAFVHLRDNRYFAPTTFWMVTVLRLLIPRVGFSLVAAGFAKFVFASAMPLAALVGLTSFTHAALMVLVVFLRPVPRHVVYFMMTYYAYCVMFSGFLINSLSVPSFFTWVSLLRPGYGGAVALELRGKPYSCDATWNMTLSGRTSYCYSGDRYIELQGFNNDTMLSDVVWLVVISILILLGVAVCMKYVR